MLDTEIIKEWLQRYRDICRDYENLLERYSVLEQKYKSIRTTNLTGMPHGTSSTTDNIGEGLARLEELSEKIQKQRTLAKEIYQEINDAAFLIQKEKCKNWADKKAVLQCRYLDLMSWNDISELLFGNIDRFWDNEETYLRRTHKLHGAALEDLAELMPPELLKEGII